MADGENNKNQYLPDFGGPLSGQIQQSLKPPGPIEVPQPQAKVSRLAAAAALTDKFLSGMQQGRMRQYAIQQSADQQKRSAISAKLAQIQSNPNLSDEAKDQAYSIAVKALAGAAQQGMDGDGKGKKGKGDDQGGNPLLGFAKKAITGLTGGPLPKGAKIDLGGTLAALSFYEDSKGQVKDQYSVAASRNKLDKQIEQTMQGGGQAPPGTAAPQEPKTREEAVWRLAKFDATGRKLYGDKVWEQKREAFLGPFPSSAKISEQRAVTDERQRVSREVLHLAPGSEEEKQYIANGKIPDAKKYNLQTRWARDPDGKLVEVSIDPRDPTAPMINTSTGQAVADGTTLVPPPGKPTEKRVMKASELSPDGKYHDYIIDSTGKTVKDLGPSREGVHFTRAYDKDTNTYYGVETPSHAGGNGKESKMGGDEAPPPGAPKPKNSASPKETAPPKEAGPPKQHVAGNRFAPKAPAASPSPATKPKGIPLGDKPPTGSDENKLHVAQVVLSSGNRLAKELDTFAQNHPDYTGQVKGRISNIKKKMDSLPPEIRDLLGQVASLKAFLPNLHGLRGKYPIQEWTETLGDPLINPQGTAGAIRGALKAVKEYNDILTGKKPTEDADVAPSGAPVDLRKFEIKQ